MEKLVFATGNINKGYEIEEKFKEEQIPVEIITMDFQEPELNDIISVAKSKVIQAYQIVQKPCFVIDSGFNIHHYPNNPNYPGAFVRRSGISENIDELLETLKDVEDRSCEFLDCLVFYDGNEFYYFYGQDEGTITMTKRGTNQKTMRSPLWLVFQPINTTKTLAEMTSDERTKRKDGHISAKEQFICWYKINYLNQQQLLKKLN